jgi:hypothetical protein
LHAAPAIAASARLAAVEAVRPVLLVLLVLWMRLMRLMLRLVLVSVLRVSVTALRRDVARQGRASTVAHRDEQCSYVLAVLSGLLKRGAGAV